MKYLALVLVLIGSLISSVTACAEPTGLSIMQEREKRHEVKESEYNESLMQIINKKMQVKERGLVIYYQKSKTGLGKTLMKFIKPGNIRNVGLLTWEQGKAKEDDQWLYLPAGKRVKRITGGSKKNLFMGTDLSYEDLRPEKLSAHKYTLVKEEESGGHNCWVIEATPSTKKEKRNSGYGKRLLWVRKDIFFITHAEYYNHGNRLIKTADFQDLVKMKSQAWRSNKSIFNRVLTKSKTVSTVVSCELGLNFPDNIFSQHNLKKPPAVRHR